MPGTRSPAPPVALDWARLPERPREVDGWRLEACGEAVLCARHPALGWGSVEALRFPLESLPELRALLQARGVEGALQAWAERDLASIRQDRAQGCPGAELRAGPMERVRVDGAPGVRVDFTVLRGGVPVERSRRYAVFDGRALHVLAAVGLDARRGCLERIGEFPLPALEAFLPLLGRIVMGSTLRER